jgi:hypothetical protein
MDEDIKELNSAMEVVRACQMIRFLMIDSIDSIDNQCLDD